MTESFKERMEAAARMAGNATLLAAKVKISRRAIGNYLSGKAEPSRPRLVAIARAAGVSVAWLVAGEGPMRPSREAEAWGAREGPEGRVEQEVVVPSARPWGEPGEPALVHSKRVVDDLAFKTEWVRRALGVSPEVLVLIRAVGDSMEPTIRNGDLLLVDTSVNRVGEDGIYVLALDGEFAVKRLQRFVDSTVVIKSDNPAYVEQTVSREQAARIHIAGLVRWVGRGA